jgi:DNA-binding MarR family transcriptional regulator
MLPMTIERSAKNGYEDLTTLERVLQLHGQFRRSLEPLRVTPLQAGVLMFLRRHPAAKVTDAADALVVRVPTVSEVVNDLVRKRWVTKRNSVEDRRVVCVQLSRRGLALALQIEEWVPHVNATLAEEERKAVGITPKGRTAPRLVPGVPSRS